MLRLDGFASLAASFDGGRVTTRPFALNGNELWVNPKVDYGELTVELLDGEEKPTPRCMAEDGVAIPVRWRADGGQPVRLRYVLNNAWLYAYRCW
jgi:hypothetical protein